MNPEITVIIPAYNAAGYLEACLESIAGQTFRAFEVIVIDDGSSDATALISGEFVRRDPRFRLIAVENGGVSRARNIGIEAARGDYLTFADADDLLHPRALERMLSILKKERADVCVSSFHRVGAGFMLKGGGEQTEDAGDTRVEVYDYPDAMRAALYQKKLMNSPCGMMIRRKTLGGERFREGLRYEDLDAFYRFFEKAHRIAYTPEPLYFYRANPQSFLHRWSEGRLDVLDVTDRLVDFFEQRYPELSGAARDRRFSAHYNVLQLMIKHDVDNEEAFRRCLKVIRKERLRALADPKVRFKNKLGALVSYGGLPLIRALSRKV